MKSSLHGGRWAEGALPDEVNEMRRRYSSFFLSICAKTVFLKSCLIVQLRAHPSHQLAMNALVGTQAPGSVPSIRLRRRCKCSWLSADAR